MDHVNISGEPGPRPIIVMVMMFSVLTAVSLFGNLNTKGARPSTTLPLNI